METLGSLTDKLCIVNLKLWHCQEELGTVRLMTDAEFQKKYKHEQIKALMDKAFSLNLQRNALVEEIDQLLVDVITGKRKPETLSKPQHKNY